MLRYEMVHCADMGDFESSVENLALAKAENFLRNHNKANYKDTEEFIRNDLKRFCEQYKRDEDYGFLLQSVLFQPALHYINHRTIGN
jgi:hypothetical protein